MWITFPPNAVKILLAWYDKARVGDSIEAVETDEVRHHAYDYRFEGSKYLTQHNPMHREANPRECQVVYVGSEETEDHW